MPITGAELSAFEVIDAGAVQLRPWLESDVPLLPALVGDWRVTRYLVAVPFPYIEADARFWVRRSARSRADAEALSWAVARPQGGVPLGGMELRFNAEGRAELGYWIGLPYQRRGYARAALDAVLEVTARLSLRAEATVDPGNAPSRNLLLSSGFAAHGQRAVQRLDGREIIHDFFEKAP